MFGMPYATEGGWRAGWSGMAARRADLDPAGRSDRKLGRHCTGFGGAAQLHGGAGGKILEDGTGPNGETLRPPMRSYHMSPADARAIVAYLKSLPAEVH